MQSLKEYTDSNKSESTESLLGGSNGAFSWFKNPLKRDEASENLEETSNGWFASANNDPFLPSLSKKQRIIGFVICVLMGTFCFSLSMLYIPFLLLKARKFALLYSLGSLFIIASFSLLWGPWNHVKHLFSGPRLPFTTAYFGTLFATLYFAMVAKSTIFTVICAIIQILALVWYIVSYIPGGQTGLNFFTKIFYAAASKTVKTTLPI